MDSNLSKITNKQVILREVKDYVMIALAMILYGVGWTLFLLPNDITTGGVPGIASVIYFGTGLPVQYSYFAINALLLLLALKTAALKGTDVRIMLPQVSDSSYMDPANKSHYQECLDAGIRIYEKTGSFIHSKTIVSDDYLSIVGSANMDFRSLELNYEINAYIYGEETARENKEIFMKDLESCREILPEQWKRRPWYRKVLETILRLFAPLL